VHSEAALQGGSGWEEEEEEDHPLSFKQRAAKLQVLSDACKSQEQIAKKAKRDDDDDTPKVYSYASSGVSYTELIDDARDVFCHECNCHFCFCSRNQTLVTSASGERDPSVVETIHSNHEPSLSSSSSSSSSATPLVTVMGPPAPVKMTEAIILAHYSGPVEHKLRQTQCQKCSFLFDSEADRDAHFLKHHTVKCADCGSAFVSVAALSEHVLEHMEVRGVPAKEHPRGMIEVLAHGIYPFGEQGY
jgi:hypothetical protein